MGFSTKTAYYLRFIHGQSFVSSDPPDPSEPSLRSCEAFDLLSAYRLLVGHYPDIDAGIIDLVILLNEMPGIRTSSSCEGHDRNYDNAYVSLSFESLSALGQFADLVEFVTTDGWEDDPEGKPPSVDLSLHLDLFSRFGDGLPIDCSLVLGKWGEPENAPGAAAIAKFTAELRHRAAVMFPHDVTDQPVR